MRVISRKPLIEFWKNHPDAEQPLRAWFFEAKNASWNNPANIKALYRNASIIVGNRVVFNIGGNKFRLVVKINYKYFVVYIRFVGTHAEYDKIDVKTI